MTKEFYEKNYKDGELIYCMPVNKNLMAFVYKDMIEGKDLGETPIRVIYYVPNKLSLGNYGVSKWDYNIETLYVSDNGTSWFVIDSSFQIDEIDNNTEWYHPQEQGKVNLAKGITNIDGDVYAYGMVRSVFKYKGIKKWENITTETKHPNLYADVNKSKETFVGSWVGFSALDGFNTNDIYAGGNQGDFWHYNGQTWRKIDLPTNFDISTITCGKDGLVYVGCRIDEMIIGRDNAWEVIGKAKEMTHSCWFDGKAYFSSKDGRIYTYDEKKKDLIEATFKTSYPEYMHHLIRGIASSEECLVAYTSVQAYAYDGEIWHEIIEIPSLSKHK